MQVRQQLLDLLNLQAINFADWHLLSTLDMTEALASLRLLVPVLEFASFHEGLGESHKKVLACYCTTAVPCGTSCTEHAIVLGCRSCS